MRDGYSFVPVSKEKKNNVFKLLSEADNRESISIQSGCFERKGLWECGAMVWQDGEQDKKCYRKGLKNLLV